MTNWKTTLCGIALAIIPAIEGYTGHDWKGYAAAILTAAFGFLAKDFNVTGVGAAANSNPPTAAQVAAVKGN